MRFGEALESIKPVPLAEVLNPAWHKWKKSGASGGELEAMEQDVRARDCPGNPQDKYLLDTLVKIATGIEKKNYSQEPSAIYYSRMVSHLASQVQSEPSRGLAISISRWCKASLFVDTHSPRVLKQYCRDHCGQRRFRKMFPSVQEQPQRIRA
jgi:hypothetical protein